MSSTVALFNQRRELKKGHCNAFDAEGSNAAKTTILLTPSEFHFGTHYVSNASPLGLFGLRGLLRLLHLRLPLLQVLSKSAPSRTTGSAVRSA